MKSPRSDALENVVRSLCEEINTPRSLSVWLCFKYNHDALIELSEADIAVDSTAEFQLSYFITNYLKKYKGLKTTHDTKQRALTRWRLSEELCRKTNDKFRELRLRPSTGRVESTLFRAQRKIAAVLGNLHFPVVLADCKWGPGATFDIKRESATPAKKISEAISVTATALPFIRAVIQSDPHWAACFLGVIPEGPFSLCSTCFKVVFGSRFLTVPKSAKIDRCIAAEPTGNGFLQQGVHSYMRRRLRRFGVRLDDQSINQKRAQVAYTSGLSTLDLSMASDTISTELIYFLLPLDWALFLDSLRSKNTLVEDVWVRTEKFASMGNAFCFELETLIFWALAGSVDDCFGDVHDVTVYGDDIIVNRHHFELVVEILEFCGFVINRSKSFRDGYFFESCGSHFHKGIEVTPVYQTEVVKHPSEVIRAHNRLSRLTRRLLTDDPTRITRKAKQVLVAHYQHRPLPKIPEGVDEDGGFLYPLSEFLPGLCQNHGFKCRVFDFRVDFVNAREDAMFAYNLRRTSYPDDLSFGEAFWSTVHKRAGSTNPSLHELRSRQFNARKTGHVGVAWRGKWRSTSRWISWCAVVG
jgi:hypothetical protein